MRQVPVRKVGLAATGIAAYLTAVFLVNMNFQLSPLLAPVWQEELWNYGTAAAMLVLVYFLSKKATARQRPELPTDRASVLWFFVVFAVAAGFTVAFWLIYNLTDPSSRVIPVLLAYVAMPLLYVGLACWRVKGHGILGFHFSAVDWQLAVTMILFATGASVLRDRVFGIMNPLSSYLPLSLAAIPMFLIQSLNNGIPEEALFRGYLLPQLFAFFRRPWLAMLVMITVFGLYHLPLLLLGHNLGPWWLVALQLAFPLQPTGLVFGYAYWRSRSLVPGIIFHTYTTLWASWYF